MKKMTNRERMLAVIRGEPLDRLPFVSYNHNAAPNEEVWSALGRDAMGILRGTYVHDLTYPNCTFETKMYRKNGLKADTTRIVTPHGELTEERVFEPTYGSPSIHKHYLEEEEDFPAFLALMQDAVVTPRLDYYTDHDIGVGDDGICLVATERTPYQQSWIQWMSIGILSEMIHFEEDRIGEVFQLMEGRLEQEYAIILQAVETLGVPLVEFADNITSPVIGTDLFRRHALPHYQMLSGMLRQAGILVGAHIDGDMKPLWSMITESGLGFIESYTPPPDNDTGVDDARRLWPEMRLFVNFPSSVHLASEEEIHRTAATILEQGAQNGRLWIQSSESVPPGIWKKSYPPIIRAIEEYGTPQ